MCLLNEGAAWFDFAGKITAIMAATAFLAREGGGGDEARGEEFVCGAMRGVKPADIVKRARQALRVAIDSDIVLHRCAQSRARIIRQNWRRRRRDVLARLRRWRIPQTRCDAFGEHDRFE